jgi:transposase
LLECLRDRQDDLLRFCSDTRVWPTNNISERDLRPLKAQQKISGRLQSADVTRDRLTIRGYISTVPKRAWAGRGRNRRRGRRPGRRPC